MTDGVLVTTNIATALKNNGNFTQMYSEYIRCDEDKQGDLFKTRLNSMIDLLTRVVTSIDSSYTLEKATRFPYGGVFVAGGFRIEIWHTRKSIKANFEPYVEKQESVDIEKEPLQLIENDEEMFDELENTDSSQSSTLEVVHSKEVNNKSTVSDVLDGLADDNEIEEPAGESTKSDKPKYICVLELEDGTTVECAYALRKAAIMYAQKKIAKENLKVKHHYLITPAGNKQDVDL